MADQYTRRPPASRRSRPRRGPRRGRLHLRCGEDILPRLAAAVEGDVAQWSDPLCEGPIRTWPSDRERRRERADYLAARFRLARPDVIRTLQAQDRALAGAGTYPQVVLWFEHDLFDQAILAFVLDRLEPAVAAGAVHLVCIDRHPSTDRFIGLGQLDAAALAGLYESRQPVTPAQVRLGRRVMEALAAPTPEPLQRLAGEHHAELPFLRAALERYLAEYPSTDNGLGRTERWALEAAASAEITAGEAFDRVQAREAAPFQGDAMFFAVLRDLAGGPRPVLAAADPAVALATLPDAELAGTALRVTPVGEAVLAERDDWHRLRGADRVIGGVRLTAGGPGWRWDERHATLVSSAV